MLETRCSSSGPALVAAPRSFVPGRSALQPEASRSIPDAAGRPVTGDPRAWGRRLAWLGGATALLVVLPFSPVGLLQIAPAGFGLVAAALGAGSGLLIGRATPGTLDRVRGRVPLWALALMAPVVGAVWGGAVGGVAGLVVDGLQEALLGVLAGGSVGAVQVGMSWFPMVFQTVTGRPVWPVVLVSLLFSPVLATIALVCSHAMVDLLRYV